MLINSGKFKFLLCVVHQKSINTIDCYAEEYVKLFGLILYQILCMLLIDGYVKYVYNNRLCSSPGQLSHISMKNNVHVETR